MSQQKIISSLAIFDYDRQKICDLYDSQNNLAGQAYNIKWIKNYNGIPTLTFVLPYSVNGDRNFRWDYMKSEYLIRLIRGKKTEWFIANKPAKSKSGKEIIGNVTCSGFGSILKTKNIYMEFDDTNGIGTVDYLLEQILKGTGWHLGYCETIYEEDGSTEKVRSLKAGTKTGALGLITTVCNLFKCYPVYDCENMLVNIYSINNRDQVMEVEVGRNADSITVNENSEDIVTRLYVEGEYGDYGYVGIDDVNPTKLNYIINFDYYKSIGVFKSTHQTALNTYLADAKDVKQRIMANEEVITEKENSTNLLIGQCVLSVYYKSEGFSLPKYVYGNPTDDQKLLKQHDEVVVMKNDGTYRYATIETTPADLVKSSEYGIAKFATKAAGKLGASEVQVEAKQKQIANLEQKKENAQQSGKTDKVNEYTNEIAKLNNEITSLFTDRNNGLYVMMNDVVGQSGLLSEIHYYTTIRNNYQAEQDDIEADFIIAMGNMLRDGYWQNNNYIPGQEEALFADAKEISKQMAFPRTTYSVKYLRTPEQIDVPIDDLKINQVARLVDEELVVHDNLFISKITIGIDNDQTGDIDVSNNDISLSSNDLGQILSRMSQLSDLIEQKNALYERAKAISASGTIYTDRLNGQIDVLKTQLLSTVSNWYTDGNGNIMFESADGNSAMMLCGAGFMIASDKDDDGNYIWRTFGTGA